MSISPFPLIAVGCAFIFSACATTSNDRAELSKADKVADCERRLQSMVQSSNATHSDSPKSALEKQNTQPTNLRFGNKNNPCRKQENVITRKVTENEAEARAMAKTRTTTALQNNDPAGAFEALQTAFFANAPGDPELTALANKTQTAYGPRLKSHMTELSTPIKSVGTCFFSPKAFGANTTPSVVFNDGHKTLFVRCFPPRPTTLDKQSTKATLTISQRTDNGKYTPLVTKELGFISELTTGLNPIDVSWPMPTISGPKGFLRVVLTLKDAQNKTITTKNAGFFWFRQGE